MFDFNVIDAFRLFDRKECGYIGMTDLRDGLFHMGVNVPQEQIDLFFIRYGLD
jgi:Ca2+-binding EF-hand superfamily protein